MRLLNAHTLEVVWFPDFRPEEKPYAILSHTWGRDEVTFQDMSESATARSKAGFAKMEAACRMAISHGLEYAWVDTCCIDKTSSAELSEAINSMFRWYEDAAVCFAYLEDFSSKSNSEPVAGWEKSRWFRRGWTLQELLAPTYVEFYDQSWRSLGTKESLAGEIEAVTRIDRRVLDFTTPLSAVSLAQRMSWAADRQTSRIEDRAYSLLGIFDVNMSMIYGEGAKAFFRLQEKIIKRDTDLSLLAWQDEGIDKTRGLLAGSPDSFRECGNIVRNLDQFRFTGEISSTNRGLKITTTVRHLIGDTYILDLHCYQADHIDQKGVGIFSRRAADTFVRAWAWRTVEIPDMPVGDLPRPMFFATTQDAISNKLLDESKRRICVSFPTDTPERKTQHIRAVPSVYWEEHEHCFAAGGLDEFKCFVTFCVTSALPNHASGPSRDEQLILSLKVTHSFSRLRMILRSKAQLDSSPCEDGFIDPFRDFAKYASGGDPLSMWVLEPKAGDENVSAVRTVHHNRDLDFVISARLETSRQVPPFRVSIQVDASSETSAESARSLCSQDESIAAPQSKRSGVLPPCHHYQP